MAKKKRSWGMLVPIGFLLFFVGGISAAGWASYQIESEYNGVGDEFLNALRSGDVEAAYGRLSPRRRARMSLAEFRPLAEHPAFRNNSRHRRGRTETWADFVTPVRACLRAALFVDDAEWALQLFYVRSDDTWYVESFALQPPAAVQLADLLVECHAGDPLGYSGPPIVNATPRLD